MAMLVEIERAERAAIKLVEDYQAALAKLIDETPADIAIQVADWVAEQMGTAPTPFPEIEPVWF